MRIKVPATFLLSAAVLTASGSAAPPNPRSEIVPSITVLGTGEVQAKPDTAQINVGVMTEGPTAAEAVRGSNEAMAQLLDTLKQQGIEERHIQTSGFNVAPKYQYDRGGEGRPPRIVGYTVSNQVQVTVRNLPSLGTVLDKVVRAGANQIHGVGFSVHDPQQQMDEARRKAVAEARRKATLYAEAAGVKLGKPILIEEVQPSGPEPLYRQRMATAEMAQAVPIATGEQTLTAVITVTFALETDVPEND